MSDTLSPYHIYAAVRRIRPELPNLVGGAAWPSISDELDTALERLRQSRDPLETMRVSVAVQRLLRDYPPARQRLMAEIAVQAAVQHDIEGDITSIAQQVGIEPSDQIMAAAYIPVRWEIQPDTLSAAADMSTRHVTLSTGGEDGKSIKFSNLWLDPGEVWEIVASTVMTGADIAGTPHWAVVTAGVLLTIRAIRRAMTVELTEHEASVFWALIQAHHYNRPTDIETIRRLAQEERTKYKLGAQSENEFDRALECLEQLRCVELVGGQWQIVEQYTIVP